MSEIDDLAWLQAAWGTPSTTGRIVVGGVGIAYRTWGREGDPGLVLIHGAAAHSAWWDHVAPQCADALRVVAVDLSGHGDSGWRDAYSLGMWSNEILAVAESAGIRGAPVLVGHSLGGVIALSAAASNPERVAGVVIADSRVRASTPDEAALDQARAARSPREYPDRDSALKAFRLVPAPHRIPPLELLNYVSARSIRQTGLLWRWKYDPRIFGSELDVDSCVTDVPVAALRSSVSRDPLPDWLALSARPIVRIPDSGHHLMLEQPLAFIASLRTLLDAWRLPTGTRATG